MPPGYSMYSWETYSPVPVKNIGCSGNTTQDMLDRFDAEVLAFHPKILVIMGGVNDFRGGTPASETTQNLHTLAEKCWDNGIYPVLVTPTPVNPDVIALRGLIGIPPEGWQEQRRQINEWIMTQPYSLDIVDLLSDENGYLRADYSVDGLHPDAEGKKLIGEAIGNHLLKTFPWVEKKKKA